jgi:hypothetical protein
VNQWPDGHLIMAASSGPSLERMVNRYLTSAGSPHRRAVFVEVGRAVKEHHLTSLITWSGCIGAVMAARRG